MSFSRTTNQKYKEALENAIKRIQIYVTDESRTLTTDENKINDYRDSLIKSFNDRYSYVKKYYYSCKETTRVGLIPAYVNAVKKVKHCLIFWDLKSINRYTNLVRLMKKH